MRTTITLEPDVARLIDEEIHRRRQPFKQIVNDAIRRGLIPGGSRRAAKPYRVAPHRAALRPGFDFGALNRLAEELETETNLRKLRRPAR